MNWRDECLTAEISELAFWSMTIGEAVRACEAFTRHRKDRAYFAFTNAMTVGMFVSSMFGSKQPPKIEDIYPDLFQNKDAEAIEEQRRTDRSVANFIRFANAFNRRFENGNRETECKNTG